MSDGVSNTTSANNVRREPPPPPPPPPPKKVEPQQWGGSDRFDATAARPDVGQTRSVTEPTQQTQQQQQQQERPGFWGNVGGFFKGAWDGGVDTVKGIGNMAHGAWNLTGGWLTNPEASRQTVDNIKNTASTVWNEPGKVVDAVTKPITDAWANGEYGKAIGRGTFEAASVVLGAKGLDKVAKLGRAGEVASAASKVDDVANAASKVAKAETVANAANRTDDVANAAAKVTKAEQAANAANRADDAANAAAATQKAEQLAKAEAMLAAKGRDVIPGTWNAQTATAEALKHSPGAERIAATAKNRPNWPQADLNAAVEKLGPNVQVHPTTSGKVYYTSPDKGVAVVHDPHANYFRVEDLANNTKRQYLDQNLNRLPPGSPDYLKNTHFRVD